MMQNNENSLDKSVTSTDKNACKITCSTSFKKGILLVGIPLAVSALVTFSLGGFSKDSQIKGVYDSLLEIEKKLEIAKSPAANSIAEFSVTDEFRSNIDGLGAEYISKIELSNEQKVAGLVGVKIKLPNGQIVPIFTTNDGKYLIPAIIDMKTRADLVQEVGLDMAAIDSGNERLNYSKDWDRLAESNYIAMGSDNPNRIVYITHDPYCPHCNKLWSDKEIAGIPKDTQIRIIPVGLQGQRSNQVVAHWFDIKSKGGDVVAAIREHELIRTNGNSAGIYGSINTSTLTEESVAQDAFNKKHLMAFGANGTPTIFYKDLVTGESNMLPGRPRDLSSLKEILGH